MATAATTSSGASSLVASGGPVLLYFHATWSDVCQDMNVVVDEIERVWAGKVSVCRVLAEEDLELSKRFGVTAVPLCVLVTGGEAMERVEGMDALELDDKMRRVFGGASGGGGGAAPQQTKGQTLDERLDALVTQKRVMLFMKGTPDEPRCGFSQKAVNALRSAGCHDFGSFDILEDPDVRQGLKEKSKWPTYPQLYCDGELVGGCDIILEMSEDGSLGEELGIQSP
jgi:Grx4 family monothiol glutaredoxin